MLNNYQMRSVTRAIKSHDSNYTTERIKKFIKKFLENSKIGKFEYDGKVTEIDDDKGNDNFHDHSEQFLRAAFLFQCYEVTDNSSRKEYQTRFLEIYEDYKLAKFLVKSVENPDVLQYLNDDEKTQEKTQTL